MFFILNKSDTMTGVINKKKYLLPTPTSNTAPLYPPLPLKAKFMDLSRGSICYGGTRRPRRGRGEGNDSLMGMLPNSKLIFRLFSCRRIWITYTKHVSIAFILIFS